MTLRKSSVPRPGQIKKAPASGVRRSVETSGQTGDLLRRLQTMEHPQVTSSSTKLATQATTHVARVALDFIGVRAGVTNFEVWQHLKAKHGNLTESFVAGELALLLQRRAIVRSLDRGAWKYSAPKK